MRKVLFPAMVALLLSSSSCYLFNSKPESPLPEQTLDQVHLYSDPFAVKANTFLVIRVFPSRSVQPDGTIVDEQGRWKRLWIRNP